jgi:hypothetical protein
MFTHFQIATKSHKNKFFYALFVAIQACWTAVVNFDRESFASP